GPFGPVAIAAGVQTMLAHPGFLILEYAWGEVLWRHELITPPETIRESRIVPSGLPGLGVALDREMVAKLVH
ncbi:uncharacterized protein METZ01_LOCUS496705, partial [marine metagenome]